MTYKVLKDFEGYKAGDILNDDGKHYARVNGANVPIQFLENMKFIEKINVELMEKLEKYSEYIDYSKTILKQIREINDYKRMLENIPQEKREDFDALMTASMCIALTERENK